MKLDLINMSKVPTAETVGESDKVLIESGGEIKKTVASNIGGGGGGVLKLVDSDGVLDHTWNEIKSALESGLFVSLVYATEDEATQTIVTSAFVESGDIPSYAVHFTDGSLLYVAASADGYPEAD